MKIIKINAVLAITVLSALALSACSPATNNKTAAKSQSVGAKGQQSAMSLSQMFSGAEQKYKNRPVKAKPKPKKVVRRVRQPVKNVVRQDSYGGRLAKAAYARTKSRVRYDGRYLKIPYPWGDVPPSMGVCTDVVIRSYRQLGLDLQQLVHRDMSQNFAAYPSRAKWGLTHPDPNIDHRRVYNLQAYFNRHGAALPVTHNPHHYKPGDLVTWMVGGTLPHIGVVTSVRSKQDPNRYLIVHNIAHGPKMEDVLFRWRVTGHYRFRPQHAQRRAARVASPASAQAGYNDDVVRAARSLNIK